ncbi:unnamed protein product [Cyclocybe aegerita]|uniref:F-box domain-containing protein n=1 Tax=Cyclocybe aegerita TaxID=1973307 RepID=A0A8S0W886_CYCAE|nr:unnamed protein product [Cyclocybe aegerita]
MGVLSKPLPLEIWMLIVKLLKPNTKANTKTLRALSRCCRALALLSQRVLFNDLHIPRICPILPARRAGALARLKDAFTRSPHLATFVRKVCYTIKYSDSQNTNLHWILNQLSNLAEVEVQYHAAEVTLDMPRLDWNALDVRLRSSIIHVVQSPRLESLTLSWIKNMPLSVFISLSSDLRTVMLQGVEVKDPESTLNYDRASTQVGLSLRQTENRRLPKITDLYYYEHDAASVLASRPFVFDFEQLQFLYISWGNERQCTLGRELMEAASNLEGLACVVDSPQKSAAGLAKAILDYSFDGSLTTLVIVLSHKTASPTLQYADDYDLLLGLIEELELLAGKNTVEYLMVHFDTTKEIQHRLLLCLQRFNDVITRKNFPYLEHFELEFWVHCPERYDGPFAAYRSRLEDSWKEGNLLQCREVSAIPGLQFECKVVIIDGWEAPRGP